MSSSRDVKPAGIDAPSRSVLQREIQVESINAALAAALLAFSGVFYFRSAAVAAVWIFPAVCLSLSLAMGLLTSSSRDRAKRLSFTLTALYCWGASHCVPGIAAGRFEVSGEGLLLIAALLASIPLALFSGARAPRLDILLGATGLFLLIFLPCAIAERSVTHFPVKAFVYSACFVHLMAVFDAMLSRSWGIAACIAYTVALIPILGSVILQR